MGLNSSHLSYIESSIEQVFGNETRGLRMLELGDQVIGDPGIIEKTGKAYFTNRGYTHVSVDINGQHGSISRDLTKPEQFLDWRGSWDILTNSGTTEHVEPFEAQYECFGIIHDCVKVGGIAIHLLPDVEELDHRGAWKNHCRYYYSELFFELLVRECQYELLSSVVINGLRCVAVRKMSDAPFMKDRASFLSLVAQRDVFENPALAALKKLGVVKALTWLGLR